MRVYMEDGESVVGLHADTENGADPKQEDIFLGTNLLGRKSRG